MGNDFHNLKKKSTSYVVSFLLLFIPLPKFIFPFDIFFLKDSFPERLKGSLKDFL